LNPFLESRYLRPGDVSAHRAEALRERPHQHVDLARIDAVVVADSPPVLPRGANAVRLVHVEIGLFEVFELLIIEKIEEEEETVFYKPCISFLTPLIRASGRLSPPWSKYLRRR